MATYQGPQKPGYGFTPSGGSAPLVQGPLKPGQERTTGGFINGSSGGGSGGGSSSNARARERQAQAEAVSKAAALLKASQEKTRQDSIAKMAEQQKQQELLTAAKARAETQAVYSEQYQGVITSKGEYYPTKNKQFIPKGAVEGYGYSVVGGEAVGPKPKVTPSVSGGGQSVKPYVAPLSLKEKATDIYGKAESFTSSKVTGPAYNYLASKGVNLTSPKFQSKFTPSIIGIGPFGIQAPSKVKEYYGEAQAAVNLDIKEKPIKQIALIGGGAALGGTVKGIQIVSGGSKVINAGLAIGGIGLAGKSVYDISKLPTEERAAAIGVSLKDIGLGAVGYGIGSKAVAYRYEPIIVKQPLREVKIPEFKEVQQTVIKNGKETVYSNLKITGERTPPMEVVKTTQYRINKGWSPKELIEVIPAKKFVIKSVGGPVPINKPYLAAKYNLGISGKAYKNVGLSEISGTSQQFKPALELGNLNPTERYALSKFMQRQTGKPVKLSSKLFDVNTELTATNIRQYTYGKINPKTSMFTPTTAGKSTSRSFGVSKDILASETPEFQVFKSTTEFKDITNPLARASGKTQALKGTIVRVKEPIVFDTTQKNLGLDLKAPKKTSWSSTFGPQQTVQENIPQLLKPTINIKPTGKTILSTPSKTISSLASVFSLIPSVSAKQTQEQPSTFKFSITGSAVKETRREAPQQIYKETPLVKTSLIGDLISREIVKQQPINKSITRQSPILKQQPIQKEIQKQIPKTITKNIFKPISPSRPNVYGFPLVPKLKKKEEIIIPFKLPKSAGESKVGGLFGVEVRRGGKFRNIGFGSLGKVQALGKSKTGRTLAATYKITGSNLGGLLTPTGYYKKSTKEGLLFIEKKKYRLSTGTELAEIFGAKRSKSRRKK